MKKEYQSPVIETVNAETDIMLNVGTIENNANMKMGGPGSGAARSRDGGCWDDEN